MKKYKELRKQLIEKNKEFISSEILSNWDEEKILKYNVKLNLNELIMNENELKIILLNVNRYLFTKTEYEYFINILSLNKILKKIRK